MATIPIAAYAIASTVPLRELVTLFDGKAAVTKASKTALVASYSGNGWAVLHDFGAVVFFGVDEAEQKRVIAAMQRFDEGGPAGGTPRAPVAESFRVEVRADVARPNASFDGAVVRELSAPIVEIVAFVIGQSVAMEYYEEDVDGLVDKLHTVAVQLEQMGHFRGRVRDLLRLVGLGMTLRNRVVRTLSLLDSPALTWDVEELDRLHRDLKQSFSIEDRYRALDHKLHMIDDNLELLVDLAQQKRSLFLEILVVVLIAIEVVLFVAQMKH